MCARPDPGHIFYLISESVSVWSPQLEVSVTESRAIKEQKPHIANLFGRKLLGGSMTSKHMNGSISSVGLQQSSLIMTMY